MSIDATAVGPIDDDASLFSRRRFDAAWFRAFQYWWLKYRRTWRGSVVYTFVYPTLYLAAMGAGLGSLITHHLSGHSLYLSLGTSSYLSYVAPGVLAGSAMQIAVSESTFPVMGAIRWERTYLAQIATPIRIVDALYGHLFFIFIRVFATCAIFCVIAAGFGAFSSPEAILAVPAATLTGLSFSFPIAAYVATQQSDAPFATINRLVIVPLFLFSGSFFPTRQLPGVLQAIAEVTPLYHGVALSRACTLGRLLTLSSLGHLLYLLVLSGLGLVVARGTFRRRLEP